MLDGVPYCPYVREITCTKMYTKTDTCNVGKVYYISFAGQLIAFVDDWYIFPFIFTCDDIYYQATSVILIIIIRAAKRIFGPQGKRKLGTPSSNSPNNDTQKVSP